MKLERCVVEAALTREPDMILPRIMRSDFIGQAAVWMDDILGFVKLKDLSVCACVCVCVCLFFFLKAVR